MCYIYLYDYNICVNTIRKTYNMSINIFTYMSTNYTDKELVLLAIIQNIPSPMTLEKVE